MLGETRVRHLLAVLGGAAPSVDDPLTLPAFLVVRASTGRRRTGMPLSGSGTPALPGPV